MYIHVGTSITTDDLSSKYIKTKSFCSLCIQTLESHLVDKTKVYVELRQRYYKMLDQKEEQVRGSLPAVYNYTDLLTPHPHRYSQLRILQEKMRKKMNRRSNKLMSIELRRRMKISQTGCWWRMGKKTIKTEDMIWYDMMKLRLILHAFWLAEIIYVPTQSYA